MKLTTRHLFRGKGLHRAVTVAGHIPVPLDDLLGPWPQPVPAPVHGAAVTQAWRDCMPYGKATAGVLHKDGWTCGECLTPTPAGGAS